MDGTLASLTYPSGRVVSYQVGGADLPTSAGDRTTTYASGVMYTPQGTLSAALLGQSVTLNQSYSSRLQPSTIHAASAGGTDLLDLAYDFGLGTADNGDVKAIVNNRDNTRTQYFSYDALNRVALANTQAATGANAWGQAFGYDPWGNLTSTTVTQGSAPSLSLSVNAKNQINGVPFTYDAAGNLLTDALNTYTWNAEGKMASLSSAQGAVTYAYDGDGKRVEKSNGKLYWYGTDGNVLAESDAAGNVTDEYIFFGDSRIARVDSQGNVDYYLSDSISSARVVTDPNGNTLDDCDFMPFGNEQCITSSSGNAYKFTGRERDSESGLDNFGARYFGSSMGRFVSPDPLGGHLEDPQSLNKYSYVRNNPLSLTDPTGLDFYLTCTQTDQNMQTCQQVNNGGQEDWVQGTTTNGQFTATVIANGPNGTLVDQNGNQYTGNFGQNGVSFTSSGGVTSNGVFENGSSPTMLSGSGMFEGFTGLFNDNCGGTCIASGAIAANGATAVDQAQQFEHLENQLKRNPGLDAIDIFHLGATNYRGGNPSGPDPHLVYKGSMFSKYGMEEFHYDGSYPYASVPGFLDHAGSALRSIGHIFTGTQQLPPPTTIP